MFESFEPNPQTDPTLSEINFSDGEGFTMNLITLNKNEASTLKGRLIGLKGIYEMDSPSKQNFTIESDELNNTVRLKGNLSNALKLLSETKLISSALYSDILANSKVMPLVERSKAFILPDDIEDEQPASSQSNRVADTLAKQQAYINALSALEPNDQENVVRALASDLSARGYEVSISKTPRSNPSITV